MDSPKTSLALLETDRDRSWLVQGGDSGLFQKLTGRSDSFFHFQLKRGLCWSSVHPSGLLRAEVAVHYFTAGLGSSVLPTPVSSGHLAETAQHVWETFIPLSIFHQEFDYKSFHRAHSFLSSPLLSLCFGFFKPSELWGFFSETFENLIVPF